MGLHWWYDMPMLRITLPFLAGILFYSHQQYYPIWILFILFTMAMGFLLARPHRFRENQIWKTGLLNTAMCMAGWGLSYAHDIRNQRNWLGTFESDTLILKLSADPSTGTFYRTATADVLFVRTPKQWKEVTARCRIRLPATLDLSEGDILTTTGKWQAIPDTGTRKSFAQFLAIQGIYHEFRPSHNRLILLTKNKTGPDRIKQLRDKLLTILDDHFPSSDERGLAKALLVGYRGELDRELSTAYSQTGVVHVIAISGLHLGLIYGLLILILRPFRHIRGFRLTSGLFILFILWIFTLICGASPSVVRSAIMFSFLICGTIMHNKPAAGNMLSASAFVMLAVKPMVVYDIGFQLSYAAVGSLLLYNKSIQSLYTPANGILNMAWSSIATSLSAQILTTPFVLYHFHQFPLLFLLANLVAIPLSGIALLLLMLLCILALLSIPAEWVAGIAEWSIQVMNERIRALAALPFGRWESIPFTMSSLVCCLLLIGTTTLYFQTKKGRALQATLGILIIWSLVIQYSSG